MNRELSKNTLPNHHMKGETSSMQINQEQKTRIEEIISEMECPKNFECYESGFTKLTKIKDIGLDTFVKCSADKPQNCPHSFPFGHKFFCKCPLRVYIAKELKI